MSLFESYERRIDQITPVLENYGIKDLQEAKQICLDKGFDPYEIVKDIRLQPIDYENFITDMTVDRKFIEDAASLCENGEVKKCLFVHGRTAEKGVLVLPDPDENAYVGWAAYIKEESAASLPDTDAQT